MAEGGGVESPADVSPADVTTLQKVRVVRCPKCQSLLPEFPGFKFYRCGGCDATLQAKKPVSKTAAPTEKFGDEKMRISEDPGDAPSAKEMHSPVKSVDQKMGSPHNPTSSGKKETASSASMKSGDDKGRISVEPETPPNKMEMPSRQRLKAGQGNQKSVGKENEVKSTDGVIIDNLNYSPISRSDSNEYSEVAKESDITMLNGPSADNQLDHEDGRFQRPSKAPVDDHNLIVDRKLRPKSEEIMQPNIAGRGENVGTRSGSTTAPRAPLKGKRFSPYPDNSLYTSQPSATTRRYEHQTQKYHARVEDFGNGTAELLRKLDEIRNQLVQSCEVTERDNVRVATNRGSSSSKTYESCSYDDRFHQGSSSLNRPSAKSLPPVNEYALGMQSRRPTLSNHGEVGRYGESFGSRIHKRTTSQYDHARRPSNMYVHKQSDLNPVSARSHDFFFHQSTCPCHHCCSNNISNNRTPYVTESYGLHPTSNPTVLGSRTKKIRNIDSSFLSQHLQGRQRSFSKKQNGNGCRPLAGGAPFIVCYNCFQLLRVPEDVMLHYKDQHKLFCGSCSQVITFKFSGKQLSVSSPVQAVDRSMPHNSSYIDGMVRNLHCQLPRNHISGYSYSEDAGSLSYNIQSANGTPIPPHSPNILSSDGMIEKEGVNTKETRNTDELSARCPDSKIPEVVVCHSDGLLSEAIGSEIVVEEYELNIPSPPAHKEIAYPLSDRVVRKFEAGNRSKHHEQKNLFTVDTNHTQDTAKDVSVATEINYPVVYYRNPDLSQYYEEVIKDEVKPKMNKNGESFFTNLRKSIKDLSRSNQPLARERNKVSVNGHHIPDRLVKKVEKQAGPIQPGEYWYDYRAGFWGVIGQPCLGIIPPFIEAFNYPMPINCASGNTAVLVNGRELHQTDFDLLVGRGLPTARCRSYIVEISGRVLDAISGEELDGLGKLAPTIEKLKRGFGMRLPQIVADQS